MTCARHYSKPFIYIFSLNPINIFLFMGKLRHREFKYHPQIHRGDGLTPETWTLTTIFRSFPNENICIVFIRSYKHLIPVQEWAVL